MSKKSSTFASQMQKHKIMAVQELEGNQVMVTMSISHWNLLQQLERSYKVARSIVRGEKECESAPSLSVVDALKYVDSL